MKEIIFEFQEIHFEKFISVKIDNYKFCSILYIKFIGKEVFVCFFLQPKSSLKQKKNQFLNKKNWN